MYPNTMFALLPGLPFNLILMKTVRRFRKLRKHRTRATIAAASMERLKFEKLISQLRVCLACFLSPRRGDRPLNVPSDKLIAQMLITARVLFHRVSKRFICTFIIFESCAIQRDCEVRYRKLRVC